MKRVTIVRPDGSKIILEGATPEEILKLSPAPTYYPATCYPVVPWWPTYVANPGPVGPVWVGTIGASSKTIIGNVGGAGGSGAYTQIGNSFVSNGGLGPATVSVGKSA